MNCIKEGIYSALITPMDSSGEIYFDSLNKLVRWQIDQGVEGFYLCGSSGEGLLLTLDERKRLVDKVIGEAAGEVPVIVHTGTIRTDDVIALSRHAAAAGAEAVSMIPPYYYNFSREEINNYYEEVVSAIDIPVIIYNIPAFTGISFTSANSEDLFDNPGIGGVKHTSMNLYDLERMKSCYPDKVYFNGYDEIFLSGLTAGATSAIGTTVNLFPGLLKGIREHFLAGDMAAAGTLQTRLNTIIEQFVKVGIFNAVKHSFTLAGIDCGSCRKPFNPLDDMQKLIVRNTLKDAGWL